MTTLATGTGTGIGIAAEIRTGAGTGIGVENEGFKDNAALSLVLRNRFSFGFVFGLTLLLARNAFAPLR